MKATLCFAILLWLTAWGVVIHAIVKSPKGREDDKGYRDDDY